MGCAVAQITDLYCWSKQKPLRCVQSKQHCWLCGSAGGRVFGGEGKPKPLQCVLSKQHCVLRVGADRRAFVCGRRTNVVAVCVHVWSSWFGVACTGGTPGSNSWLRQCVGSSKLPWSGLPGACPGQGLLLAISHGLGLLGLPTARCWHLQSNLPSIGKAGRSQILRWSR